MNKNPTLVIKLISCVFLKYFMHKKLFQTGFKITIASAVLYCSSFQSQAAGLPDTGQSLCYDKNKTELVDCAYANTGDNSQYPGQDARFGRDAAVTAGKIVKTRGTASFDYSKVCNSGVKEGQGSCPENPVLGNGINAWGCTIDNITGLMWEIKLSDKGFRDKSWTYSWYNSDNTNNGGFSGFPDDGDNCADTSRCDTEKFIADVNAASLCGNNDWRVPSIRELRTLIHRGKVDPAVDGDFFPNAVSLFLWSASSYVATADSAWTVHFFNGTSNANSKTISRPVRLVRGVQF